MEGAESVEAVRYALVEGTRRVFSMKYVCLPDSTVAATAIDVTEKAQAEGRLRLNMEAAADMLDGLPLAVAVFDEDRRLENFNAAYAGLWELDENWLETHPTLGEILDRLRAARKLPEQPDFAAWKAGQLRLFEECPQPHEEFWHLAGGRSLRVVVAPHLLGGLSVVIEDISEKLRLEVSFKLLLQVQRATLDTVDDGIAIFGPDGRLVLFNANFAKLWHFTDEELLVRPHFTKIANLAESRLGHDGIWSIVSAGITSAEPERCNDWGKAVRADGRVISLSMSRLPNGATIATFLRPDRSGAVPRRAGEEVQCGCLSPGRRSLGRAGPALPTRRGLRRAGEPHRGEGRILIVNGHPDPRPERFCAALCKACHRGAHSAGRQADMISLGALPAGDGQDFGHASRELAQALDLVRRSNRLTVIFPLWLDKPPVASEQILPAGGRGRRARSQRRLRPALREFRRDDGDAGLCASLGLPGDPRRIPIAGFDIASRRGNGGTEIYRKRRHDLERATGRVAGQASSAGRAGRMACTSAILIEPLRRDWLIATSASRRARPQ